MIRILINDGIDAGGKKQLEDAGFDVVTTKVPQDQLKAELPAYDVILVRSATTVRQDLIDACPRLKVIGRGGVGLDNIDVEYAESKGIQVINTPAASSQSVAELVFAHLFGLARGLHDSNRKMPVSGDTEFNTLKKSYAKGFQLRGRTMGILGIGRIGQETARIALGLGMNVLATDLFIKAAALEMEIPGAGTVSVAIPIVSMDEMLAKSDVISLHVPFSGGKAPIGAEEIYKMKDGVVIINAARGGAIDEDVLLEALDSGKVAFAGLDVFDNEPTPRRDLLEHPNVSLSPHIGASTGEAQLNIGKELADKLIAIFK